MMYQESYYHKRLIDALRVSDFTNKLWVIQIMSKSHYLSKAEMYLMVKVQ